MKYRMYFLCLVLGVLGQTARAQDTSRLRLTLTVKDTPVDAFVRAVESRLPVHFFFNPAQVQSVKVSAEAHDQPLEQMLAKAFAGTGLYFTLDDNAQIFVAATPLYSARQLAEGSLPRTLNRKRRVFTDSGFVNRDAGRRAPDDRLYVIGKPPGNPGKPSATIAGTIYSAKSGETIAGASVFTTDPPRGVNTDAYGSFEITLPKGRRVLHVQSVGLQDVNRRIDLYADGKMNVELAPQEVTLKNVTVSGTANNNNVKSLQLGLTRLDIRAIKQVPVVFGEADVLRALTTLPGVKTVGEASTGLNVRGGAADQNLILFNDATIFNAAHFFGLFSVFNPDIVRDVELYKSSIPARYGGRLSSVVNVTGQEGSKKEFGGSAGIGVLSSRLEINGPIVKDKTSFIFGGRTTYANWLLNLLPDQYKHSRASFYDLNLSVNHAIDKNNNLYGTAYLSQDHFNLNSDTTYNYRNQNVALKWKHTFSNNLYALVGGGYDRYQYEIASTSNPVEAYKLHFDVNQAWFKANFYYHLSDRHALEFGLSTIRYKLDPGTYTPQAKQSLVRPDTVAAERALESALYLSDRFAVSSRLSLEAGLRYSLFNFLGPQAVNEYNPGVPKTEDDIIGVRKYAKNDFIKTYSGPEYRVSLRYLFSDSFSVKAGYSTQRQYIHVLSNTTAIAPTDIYKLSDPNIRPQFGDQVSLGLFKTFPANAIEVSVEGYYKHIEHYLDYKSGALLVLNHHIETDVLNTKGKAYGVEFLLRKLAGKLNGWISYTWSRTFIRQDDPTAGETINKGDYYPANYDKPHEAAFIGNYRVNHRFSVSLNATYSTGRPITLPYGLYSYAGSFRTLYADRNAYRIPDYFRTDLAVNIEGNHKVHQLTHNSWTIGVYNLTGRKNPYSVYYVSENGAVNGYRLSIFGSAIPYVNFNIRF